MRLHISEMTFFQDKRAEILKETAAEKQRGRAWETKLRQAASEARELRKALDEEELICKERMDALEKRQRDSEGSGLQAAIASIASIARVSVSMSQSSQSVRESALKLGHLGSSACSRQEKLKQELHTAEDLRFEISSQVSESCLVCSLVLYNYRRKFRSETSDNMDSWKAEVRRVRREKIRRKKMRRERVRRKKMQMREKVGTSRFTVFFQWFVAPEGRKVGSLKRRVRSQLARWEMKKCTPLWREAHFQVKMYKAHQVRTTFGSWDVEKVHAVVARSTFPSQNVQNAPGPDHFWKLRCRKSARRCGAKHISKSKCTKHTMVGPLLEVEMSKKCTPLWREAHFQVKSVKNWRSRTTFWRSDVEKVSKKCTPLWREAHFEVKSVKNWGFWAFFDVKMSKK